MADDSIPRALPIFREIGIQQASGRDENGGARCPGQSEGWQVLKGELWRPDKHRLPRVIYACCLLTNIMIDLEDAVRDRMPASHNHDDGYRQQISSVMDDDAVMQRDLLSRYISRLGSRCRSDSVPSVPC